MHELSLVLSVIDIASEQASKHHAHWIEKIELDIGTMAGVEMDAFEFAWDEAVKGTVLERAERQINAIQATARCLHCDTEFPVFERFEACPICHDFLNEFVQGKELRVKSLVLPDEQTHPVNNQ